MKIRLFAALMIAVTLMTGCSMGQTGADLTKEEARQIALNHAGLTESQVTRLKTELDYDNGVPEYDVEFHFDGWEYDYEIDAQTGEILEWNKEIETNGK